MTIQQQIKNIIKSLVQLEHSYYLSDKPIARAWIRAAKANLERIYWSKEDIAVESYEK